MMERKVKAVAFKEPGAPGARVLVQYQLSPQSEPLVRAAGWRG